MKEYNFCSVCRHLTLSRYNFETLVWECSVCGQEQTKPEDEIWKKKGGRKQNDRT